MSPIDLNPITPPSSPSAADRVVDFDVTPPWQSYLDLQDAKQYLQYPDDKASIDDEQTLQLFIDGACHWVQDFLGRPVAPTEYARRFDGWSGRDGTTILLPYYPIIGDLKVTEWRGGSPSAAVYEQTPVTTNLHRESFQVDRLSGRLIRTFPGNVQKPWFPGSRNIEVTWTAGYVPIPPTIRLATLEIFAHWYRNTQEAPRTFRGLKGEYDPALSGAWPAIPQRAVSFLQTYEQVGIG